jgi:hypothetical protein
MKISSDTIGYRTRDLPTCSAVPQPTSPPRASESVILIAFPREQLLCERASVLRYTYTACLVMLFRHPRLCPFQIYLQIHCMHFVSVPRHIPYNARVILPELIF